MSVLLDITPLQVMTLWEDLMECKYNDNHYGSDTAEIYLFRLMPFSPLVAMDPTMKDSIAEYAVANLRLYELCKIFEERQNVEIEFAGGHPLELLIKTPKDPFTHRVHLTVRRK